MSKHKRKKIKPANVITVSLPDDLADELKKFKERGMKSKIVTEALRRYFKKEPKPTVKETIKGFTEEEILKQVQKYLYSEFHRKYDELEAKIEKARKEENWSLAGTYRQILYYFYDPWMYPESKDRSFLNEITMAEVQKVLGLPYMVIYNKVLPILRKEGYKIVDKKLY